MKTIAFFNNKGGVGKTPLVYHLSWMLAQLGKRVLAVDLDPQANLSSMFLPEERLEELWPEGNHPSTIHGVVEPILRGIGDIASPHVEHISTAVGLLVGDLALSGFEDKLSQSWPLCHNRDEAAFRAMTAFYRAATQAARTIAADVILIDVGPNLGAINRSALISADYVVIPLASDLFSLQGLRNLGPRLREWRYAWADLEAKNPAPDLKLPGGGMQPLGYVLTQHSMRADRPVKAYLRWMARVPDEYHSSVLDHQTYWRSVADDPECLATLKHYRSLMPLAREARKPMFFLKPADGAIGAHGQAVSDCYEDFKALAGKILDRAGIAA